LHAEVRIDDAVIMLADASIEFPDFPAWLHGNVPEVDHTYWRELKAGGVSVQEPQLKEDDTDRRGGVTEIRTAMRKKLFYRIENGVEFAELNRENVQCLRANFNLW